jgi:hypothetical protein
MICPPFDVVARDADFDVRHLVAWTHCVGVFLFPQNIGRKKEGNERKVGSQGKGRESDEEGREGRLKRSKEINEKGIK